MAVLIVRVRDKQRVVVTTITTIAIQSPPLWFRLCRPGWIVHHFVDVQSQIVRGDPRTVSSDLGFESFLGCNARLPHRLGIVFLVIGVQSAFPARLVVAVGRLAEMSIGILFIEGLPAHVAHLHSAGAGHLVAAIRFDELLVAFWTGPHLSLTESLFDLEASLVTAILLDNLFASEWDVRCLVAFPARDKSAALDGACKNILQLGHHGLVAALWAHGEVFSQPGLLDLDLCLHFGVFFPGLLGQDLFQHLISKSRVTPASLAAFDFQIWLLVLLVNSQIP